MKRVLFAAVTVALMFASSAQALDRRVRIVNKSSDFIYQVFGSNRDRSDWEEDVLGDDVLAPGDSIIVNFNDRSGYCIFDLKAVTREGAEAVRYGFNVCSMSTWNVTD